LRIYCLMCGDEIYSPKIGQKVCSKKECKKKYRSNNAMIRWQKWAKENNFDMKKYQREWLRRKIKKKKDLNS